MSSALSAVEEEAEIAPFLDDPSPGAAGTSSKSCDNDRPLPLGQILLLCYSRFVEPVAFFGIFPFINAYIHSLGVPAADVGFWSGSIEGAFALTQTVFMLFWGRVSDRYGRKPVLVLSLVGVAVASVLFGFARTVWEMIAIRCLEGVFAGTLVTVRTMITENSTSKTQARAFSFFAFAGNFGIFAGSLLGGALADPSKQYPQLFGDAQLFKHHPYLLPCIANGVIATLAAVMDILWLRETLPAKKEDELREQPPSLREVLRSPGVISILSLSNYMNLLGMGFQAVMPVLFFTPVALGGWGFTPPQISYYFAAGGICQAPWVLIAFPLMSNRLGMKNLMRIWTFIYPFCYVCMIMQSLALQGGNVSLFMTLLVFQILIGTGVSMVNISFQLAVNNVCPSPLALGTLSGLSLSTMSAIRSVAPPAFASLYAMGVKDQIMAGQLGVVVPMIMSVGLFMGIFFWLPKEAEERVDTMTIAEEEIPLASEDEI